MEGIGFRINEDFDSKYEEESSQSQGIRTSEIYSFVINGINGVLPIQLIASCMSDKFEDIMTNLDMEELLIAMSESQTLQL